MDPKPIREYVATNNCVLCDEKFPDSQFCKAEALGEWSYFFRAGKFHLKTPQDGDSYCI